MEKSFDSLTFIFHDGQDQYIYKSDFILNVEHCSVTNRTLWRSLFSPLIEYIFYRHTSRYMYDEMYTKTKGDKELP